MKIYGVETGLYAALVFGIAGLLFTWFRERRLDRFILFDTVFLVLLGGFLSSLKTPIFFKLKPAVIELIICAILGAAAAKPELFLKAMTGRYIKNMELKVTEEGYRCHEKMMLILTAVFLMHTILTVYSAFFMSERCMGIYQRSVVLYYFRVCFLRGMMIL
jgi:intracellular septation protein A